MFCALRFVVVLGFMFLEMNNIKASSCLMSGKLNKHICRKIRDAKFDGTFVFGHGSAIDAASTDFGGVVSNKPAGVLLPGSIQDISKIIMIAGGTPNLTVSAYGNGHSTNGQAQALGGIVVNMTMLKGISIVSNGKIPYVDASGGELWVDILRATLAKGLSPRSFTDYLDLTVGGTLSNAGISGQTHIFGPQISNVLQLEVVTGKGEMVTCSNAKNSDLFNGVLGGLGQFGIITKARIILQRSHDKARVVRLVYSKVETFMKDQEKLIRREKEIGFDYVEGFVYRNKNDTSWGWQGIPLLKNQTFNSHLIPPNAGPHLYVIELALYYNVNNDIDTVVEKKLSKLNYIRGLEFTKDVSYFDFLYRVHEEEVASRKAGLWNKPHAWLNILVSHDSVSKFDKVIFQGLLKNGIEGLVIFYPLRINGLWGRSTSAVIPRQSDVFYAASLLRFDLPYPAGRPLSDLLAENQRVLQACRDNNIAFKVYLGKQESQGKWIEHFGNYKFNIFKRRKHAYDPKAILAPGQNIFNRTM